MFFRIEGSNGKSFMFRQKPKPYIKVKNPARHQQFIIQGTEILKSSSLLVEKNFKS